jgi:hypothetical protein
MIKRRVISASYSGASINLPANSETDVFSMTRRNPVTIKTIFITNANFTLAAVATGFRINGSRCDEIQDSQPGQQIISNLYPSPIEFEVEANKKFSVVAINTSGVAVNFPTAAVQLYIVYEEEIPG